MSKNVRTPDSCIKEFLDTKFRGSKPYTKDKCRWSLQRSKKILEEGGFDASPYKIKADAVEYILKYHRSLGRLDTSSRGRLHISTDISNSSRMKSSRTWASNFLLI